MIKFLVFMICSFAYSNPSWKWSQAIEVAQRHEFYADNEIMNKPSDSWQILFSILYRDSSLNLFKDCVYYYVPGEKPGKLKIKTVSANKKCEDEILKVGDQEWDKLKAVQFSLQNNYLSLTLTQMNFKVEAWDVPLFNIFKHPIPSGLMSSAQYRSPKAIFLNPYKASEFNRPKKSNALKDKVLCHDVAEDCEEKSPSVCSQCENGWFESPNGCPQGPKYCGISQCGQKHQVACRRGMKFQGEDKKFNCREDHSFSYCAKGLMVQCQGSLAYCL